MRIHPQIRILSLWVACALSGAGCSLLPEKIAPGQRMQTYASESDTVDVEQIPKNAKIVKAKPEKPTAKALVDFAHVQMSVGGFENSEKMLRRAIKTDKKYAPAYCALSQLYMAQNRTEKSLEVLTKVPKGLESSPLILNEKAIIHCKLKNYDEAEELLRLALDEDPENEMYLMNLAGVLAVSGDYDEAYKLYSSKLGPAEARYRIAGVLYEQGKVESSRQQLELAMRVDPKHEKSAAMLVHLARGDAAVKPASFVAPAQEEAVKLEAGGLADR
jgi:tetratricopeptide (TPR) repeat protein